MRVLNLSYINSLPFRELKTVQGCHYAEALGPQAAAALRTGGVDFALVPTGTFSSLPSLQIHPFGIATNGFVGSVTVFATAPLEELDEILLDGDSRTSVKLLEFLLRRLELSHLRTTTRPPAEIPKLIQGRTGGLLIGDNALKSFEQFPVRVDLPELWTKLTGLPLVFAAWASIGKSESEIRAFHTALRAALKMKERLHQVQLAEHASSLSITAARLERYLKREIHHEISPLAWTGTQQFLREIGDKTTAEFLMFK